MREIRSFRGDYFFLSNFFRCDFDIEGFGTVRSAEHAYNALKTLDSDEQQHVLAAETPGEAKRRGQSVTITDDWDTGGRVSVMLAVIDAKFSEPALGDLLRDTGNAVLIEGNTHHDNFWGDCTCGRPECELPGKNMLGEILMSIRCELPHPAPDPEQTRRDVDDWDDMIEWAADSLVDQPAGLAVSFGPKDVRMLVDKEAILVDLDNVIDDEDDEDDDEPLVTCSQIYVLRQNVFLVRRSRVALLDIRFIDHDPRGIELNTWFHDDPFDDCTDGYFYTRDRHLAAEAAVSWFRDNPGAPTLEQLGLHYEFARNLPDGTDRSSDE